MNISQSRISRFQDKIFTWWEDNQREFLWRQTRNPYYITVSEYMLQQTQADRVEKKYKIFISQFPGLEDLAKASKSDVIKLWSGLGYNRRAIWMKETINKIYEQGYFPTSPRELIKFKGIGPYTSRSIPIFAFNANLATVDTNIRRILVYEGFATENDDKTQLFKIAKKLVPEGRSRDWHNALMDYGAIVVTSKSTGIKPKTSQIRYKGSKREIRGKTIKLLTEFDCLSLSEIKQKLRDQIDIATSHNFDLILEALVNDGLISHNGSKYCLSK